MPAPNDLPAAFSFNYLRVTLLILFGGWACTAHAQLQDLQITGSKTRIDLPFQYTNGFIVVPVVFENWFPLNFIFDTGAEHTILSQREITDLLQLEYRRRFTLVGADLSREFYAYLVSGINLQAGAILAKNRSILVLEEDYLRLEDYTGVKIHGILGADFFRRFIIKINYRKRVISLYDPSAYRPPSEGYTRINVEFSKSKPYVFPEVVLRQGDTSTLKLLLDTGAALPLLINMDSDPGLVLPEHVIPSNLGAGLGGFLRGYKGKVPSLQLPPFRFSSVVTSYQDLQLGEIDSTQLDQRNGILGNEILRRFTVILDYIHEEAYLQPNKDYDDEFKVDRSGLLIIATGPTLRDYLIYSVLEDTPAQEAGLQTGDEIKRINWMPTTLLSLSGLIGRLQKPAGKKVRLVVKRNGKRIRTTFELRDLI
ncbi:MAG: aspartyl protease family protein [Phaeodactylibacter sp.]|uniref:aspartyl protease family protein n=1 Tax=Phaeodactylibacter sp. TaxID=1940289 RepID=UPI0032ED35DE